MLDKRLKKIIRELKKMPPVGNPIGLREYIEKYSTQKELADKLYNYKTGKPGIRQSAVSQMVNGQVPDKRVLEMEWISERLMGRCKLRPDLYYE